MCSFTLSVDLHLLFTVVCLIGGLMPWPLTKAPLYCSSHRINSYFCSLSIWPTADCLVTEDNVFEFATKKKSVIVTVKASTNRNSTKSNISFHSKACIVASNRMESRWSLKGEARGMRECVWECVWSREGGTVSLYLHVFLYILSCCVHSHVRASRCADVYVWDDAQASLHSRVKQNSTCIVFGMGFFLHIFVY